MRVAKAVAALTSALVLAGCQAGAPTPKPMEELDALDLMRKTVSHGYSPYHTPREMFLDADVALVGEVESVDVALIEDPEEKQGAVIVGLRPVEEWKGTDGAHGDAVYYWFDRPTDLGAATYREVLPQGTTVVLFALDAATSSDVRFATQVPDKVFAPLPQGMFLADTSGEIESVWADDEYATSWNIQTVDDIRRLIANGGKAIDRN